MESSQDLQMCTFLSDFVENTVYGVDIAAV